MHHYYIYGIPVLLSVLQYAAIYKHSQVFLRCKPSHAWLSEDMQLHVYMYHVNGCCDGSTPQKNRFKCLMEQKNGPGVYMLHKLGIISRPAWSLKVKRSDRLFFLLFVLPPTVHPTQGTVGANQTEKHVIWGPDKSFNCWFIMVNVQHLPKFFRGKNDTAG